MRNSSQPCRKREICVSPKVLDPVSDWNFHEFQVTLSGSEDQIEVAEWVKFAEIASTGNYPMIMAFVQRFCSA